MQRKKRVGENAGMAAFLLTVLMISTGCISDDLTVKTSGKFNGTYTSFEGTYSGTLSFNFEQKNEELEVEGTIIIDGERISFEGTGTLTENPAVLDLDVKGTDFQMHIEGEVRNGHLSGSYNFTSSRWGNDWGSVELDLS